MSAADEFARIYGAGNPSIDNMTGLPTRAAGMDDLAREIEIVRRSASPELAVAVIVIDALDGTKRQGGAPTCDSGLRAAATTLRKFARRSHDVLFMYGADEFVCALPFLDLDQGAALVLDAWRALDEEHRHSFSAGFAELRDGDDAMTVVGRAAECLYAGRRRPDRGNWSVAL